MSAKKEIDTPEFCDLFLDPVSEASKTNDTKKKISSYGAVAISSKTSSHDNKFLRTRSSFVEDFIAQSPGSIPHSIVVALIIGTTCGIAANVYYVVLEWSLKTMWKTLPNKFVVGAWPDWTHPFWITFIGFVMAIGVGLTVLILGEPGDIASTVKAVHHKGYLSMDHCMPMVLASLFTMAGGGSLGPEAPLVAICACLGGFVSRMVFKQTERNIIRKHTLMGMAGALSAFFGAPLGGSLFALEINSRLGVEYFEHVVESVFCGEITLIVFRSSSNLPIGPIWTMTSSPMGPTKPSYIFIGAFIGLLGAFAAACFAHFHWALMGIFNKMNVLKHENAVGRALLGASAILTIGIFIPQTLFWGEIEFQQISTLSANEDLPHVWPTSGLIDFEMDSGFKCFLVGFFKMIAISFSLAGGYRGGFIFPFFAAGAAFGRAIMFIVPSLPSPYACLCFAASINVAITRTSLATPIILCFLSNQQNAMSAVLAASLSSLFATSYMVRGF